MEKEYGTIEKNRERKNYMTTITKETLEELKSQFKEEGIEILADDPNEWIIFDEYDGKESLIRLINHAEKETLLNDIVDTGTSSVDKKKLISLLKELDDHLLLSVKKILFIKDEKDYDNLSRQFDNIDRIDFEHEVGKYLYFEDWVVINLYAIEKTVREMTVWEEEIQQEMNIGIWITLFHELRHTYQMHPLFGFIEGDIEDIEEDAEEYGIEMFENHLYTKDYTII